MLFMICKNFEENREASVEQRMQSCSQNRTMLTEVFGVSSSIVFAKNGGYAVLITPGVKKRSKQLQNLLLASRHGNLLAN